MKKLFILVLPAFLLLAVPALGQKFTFAFVSDTHIGSGNGSAEEDLQRTVAHINAQSGIAFVLFTGDITEMGTDAELQAAKKLISQLKVPYYVVPGNHDTGWSESGGVSFIREFGADKYVFEHQGYKFLGCASGPYVRMSDGHIPRDAVVWLDSVLAATPKNQPLVFFNHYPLDNSLDNWYEVTDRLKQYNTQFALCGHGHANSARDFEGIPGTMGRSNLRAGAAVGGYNLVTVRQDSALFTQITPGQGPGPTWRRIALGPRQYTNQKQAARPVYTMNGKYPHVQKKWSYHAGANVISTPVYTRGRVIFGNSLGQVEALSQKNGQRAWTFKTRGGIFSSPAAFGDLVILGSGDGSIYALEAATGRRVWETATGAAVLGTPVVQKGVVYIGGSDGRFRALDARTGKEKWHFQGLEGPVVSKPLLFEGKVIFGAWDKNLYALNQQDGTLTWKWTNGSANRMYSPAMVEPVAAAGVVYIVAPDRYMTAIDAKSGQTLWRSKEATVRESIGLSEDKKLVYGKTMQDEIVAFKAQPGSADLTWRLNCGFGYEHVPSMLVAQSGAVYFGTRNGVVYSIDSKTRKVNWAHKIDNSMVNTVNPISRKRLVAATMDGKVEMLEYR